MAQSIRIRYGLNDQSLILSSDRDFLFTTILDRLQGPMVNEDKAGGA
jgi:hypothetical protein